jgi:tetratricopeptide (TPR) repeat protein
MRAALEKAIALRPDFVEAYSLLALVNLVTGSRLDESIEMVTKAQRLAKGRNDLTFMLAQLYMVKRDYKTARDLLQTINTGNSKEELLQRAQSLLAQIASIEEQEASFRDARQRSSSERPVLMTTRQNENTDALPADPSSYLRDALRKPQAGETQVQGRLVRIDCDQKGMTFVVRIEDRMIKLRSTSFESVDMTSFSADSGGEITCGPRKPENNVVVSYVASSDSRLKVDGVAKSLEFVPPDFKLKP